jgi:NAD-dependent dihydropyrimidine dehydrogenase PreA subunit
VAKLWYPVINYEKCIECRACVNKCSHGVYDKEEIKPVVIYPDGCIQGCRGCQKLCPAGAIEYIGDIGEEGNCSCGCSSC